MDVKDLGMDIHQLGDGLSGLLHGVILEPDTHLEERCDSDGSGNMAFSTPGTADKRNAPTVTIVIKKYLLKTCPWVML